MAGFFTTPTDTNYHSGLSVGSIKNGDTQTSVNEKLAEEIESLKAKINQMQNASPVSNTDSIENKSGFGISDTFISTDLKVMVTTKPSAAGVDVTYDLKDALGSDTKIFNKVSVEGLKNGVNTILVDSDKITSGFFLSPDNFPAYLTVDLRKKTSTGDEFLSAKIPLKSTGESLATTLYSRKFGGTDLNTQTKVNDFLFERVKTLENNIPKEVIVNNDRKTIQDAINELSSEVKRLKEENESLKSSVQNRPTSSASSTSTQQASGRSSTTTASTSTTSTSSRTSDPVNSSSASAETTTKTDPTSTSTGTTSGTGRVDPNSAFVS